MITSLLLGFALVQDKAVPTSLSSLTAANVRVVIVVSPRTLTDEESDRIKTAARAERSSEIADLGAFRPFTFETRRLAIWSGFLLEDRYTLSKRVMKRLGDIWRPEEIMPLEGESDLRPWIVQSCPSDESGNAGYEAPVFRLTVQPRFTFAVGDDRKRVLAVSRVFRKEDEAHWPTITAKPIPRKKETTPKALLPSTWTISTDALYDVGESLHRLELVTRTITEWHREQERQMKKACAAFFTKRDDSLAALFGGSLPVGRRFETLGPDMKRRIEAEIAGSSYRLYGFETKEEAKAWIAKATVVSVEPILYGDVPVYNEGRPNSLVFPIHLP